MALKFAESHLFLEGNIRKTTEKIKIHLVFHTQTNSIKGNLANCQNIHTNNAPENSIERFTEHALSTVLFLFTYRLLIFGSYSGRSWNKSDIKKFPQFVNWNNVKDLSYLTSNFKPHHFPPFFVVTITCARASKYSIQSPLITIEAVSGSLRKYPGNFNRYL